MSISEIGKLLYSTLPLLGLYKPTNNFINVVLPLPDGPTKAMVSPLFTLKFTLDKAGLVAVKC